jgi:putative transposase
MTKEMTERSETIFRETLKKWESDLVEFKGGEDHVYLLFETNPSVQLSRLVNNLKTVSSRLLRRDFREELGQTYPHSEFWQRSYLLMTMGRAAAGRMRKYIEEQGRKG